MSDELFISESGIFPDANDSYYGAYRTRTFADIFPSVDVWNDETYNSEINLELVDDKIELLYYLLYGRYGNSHISYSDEHQFKYALFTTIFMYGPAWVKRLEIQESIITMSEEEVLKGGKAIYNHAYNPGTSPSTSTLEELTAINDQNTTNYKKSKLEGYRILMELIKTDVSEEFLNKFRKLFIKVLAPDYPLLYKTEVQDD